MELIGLIYVLGAAVCWIGMMGFAVAGRDPLGRKRESQIGPAIFVATLVALLWPVALLYVLCFGWSK